MDFIDTPLVSSTKSKPPPTKQAMAVLTGPTRSFAGWANVRTSKISRSIRRYVIIRSSKLTICSTENPRTQILSVPITGATMLLTSVRHECVVRTSSNHRMWIQWPSESDLRVCKAAFEFANRHIDDYYKLVTHRQLGKGRNSEVVFAFDTATGDHAAVKVLNKDKARSTDREFADKEVRIRMTIQHPCIVQTLDIFETPYDLFVVMELMNGSSLDRRINKYNEPLSEFEACVVMCRLFSALRHLHSRRIVHRNVKPQNIYLDSADDVRWPYTTKLADFSLACSIDDPDAGRQIVGTPEYLEPCATIMSRTESGERAVVFGTEIDMWAAGVTLYNLLSLELPFEGEYPPDVFKKVRLGRFEFGPAFEDITDNAKSLIRALLNVDRRKRPTAATVMLHPWFRQLNEYSGNLDENSNEDILDDGALTGAPCVFESYEEYAFSDGIRRFRCAAMAVIVLVRLSKRFMSPHLSHSIDRANGRKRIEKRFQFNVSGIDIAPLHPMLDEDMPEDGATHNINSGIDSLGEFGNGVTTVNAGTSNMNASLNSVVRGDKESTDGNLHVLQGRASGTVMSRVSTGSTVKSRSSRGTDSNGPVVSSPGRHPSLSTDPELVVGTTAPLLFRGKSSDYNNVHNKRSGGDGSVVGYGSGGGFSKNENGSRQMTTTTRLMTTTTMSTSTSMTTTSIPEQSNGYKLERSDTSVDYFGHGERRREMTGSTAGIGTSGGAMSTMNLGLMNAEPQPRLLSDTAELVCMEEDKGTWRRRWRGR